MFTLGREIDIHYPTNRLILIIAAITGIIGGFLSANLLTGLKMGAAIFLTWAFGREAEPRREYAAFVGVTIAILYSFLTDGFMIAFLELLFILLLLRIMNTTSGQQPTILDAGSVLALAGYLYYSTGYPIFLLIYFMGLFLSQAFKENKLLNIFLGAAALASGGYTLYLLSTQARFSSPILSPFTLILLITLYILTVYQDKDKKIYNDAGSLINSGKIVIAQIFFALVVLLLAFLSDPLIGNMIVYTSTIAGVILYRPINKVFKFEE